MSLEEEKDLLLRFVKRILEHHELLDYANIKFDNTDSLPIFNNEIHITIYDSDFEYKKRDASKIYYWTIYIVPYSEYRKLRDSIKILLKHHIGGRYGLIKFDEETQMYMRDILSMDDYEFRLYLKLM